MYIFSFRSINFQPWIKMFSSTTKCSQYYFGLTGLKALEKVTIFFYKDTLYVCEIIIHYDSEIGEKLRKLYWS